MADVGEKNLIPFSERTEDERRTLARAGGIASGEARRRKKTLREAADLFLSLKVKKDDLDRLLAHGVKKADADQQMLIIAGLCKAAQAGDAKAARVLFDLLPDANEQSGDMEDMTAIRAAVFGDEDSHTDP